MTDEDAPFVKTFLATGRVEDFEVLVERHRRSVFRIAIAVIGHGGESLAEDVTQEVFLRVYRNLHTFESRSRFATWLHRLTYNCALDQLRSRRARPEVALAFEPAITTGVQRDLLRDEALADCISQLPHGQRTAVHLHYWLGHTSGEIAGMLGVQPGTAKLWIFRARHLLARCLARKGVPS